MRRLGRPLEEGDASRHQPVGVDEWSTGQLLFEESGELADPISAMEDPAAFEDDARRCDVALDVLLEAMLTGEIEVVVEHLER